MEARHRAPLAKPPTIDIALGDDLTAAVATPFAMPTGKAVWHPISITSTVRRDIELYVFGAGEHVGLGNDGDMYMKRSVKATVRPDQPFAVSVLADPESKVTLVVVQPGKTIATERDVYGEPPAGAALAAHALADYAFFAPAQDRMTRDNAELAGPPVHETISPAFFVYGIAAHAPCKLVAGEPVLMLDDRPRDARERHGAGLLVRSR